MCHSEVSKTLSHDALMAAYSGYCWFVQAKQIVEREATYERAVLAGTGRFRHGYGQVIVASFIINFHSGQFPVCNEHDWVIPSSGNVMMLGVSG